MSLGLRVDCRKEEERSSQIQEGVLISVREERSTAAARCHDWTTGMGERSDCRRLQGERGANCSDGTGLHAGREREHSERRGRARTGPRRRQPGMERERRERGSCA